MPPPLLIDPDSFDANHVEVTRERIYELLPHRFEFELLHGVCHYDPEKLELVAYRDIRPGDWWFRGHVPGRPLLPGVLMLEMAAQASALISKLAGDSGMFFGFGGVDECKFRDAVVAPARLLLLCVGLDQRARRIISTTQGVVDGRLIFEAKITGLAMR